MKIFGKSEEEVQIIKATERERWKQRETMMKKRKKIVDS